jgi:F-type H+-transporting ATPase subunit a
MASGPNPLDPMHQFEITPLIPLHIGGYDLSFTNSTMWMFATVLLASAFLTLAIKRNALVPDRIQSVAEMIYEMVSSMVRSTMGDEGKKFFPFIFSLFVFVLFANMLGMLPYSFTVTSHIIVTFALAAFIFLLVLGLGIVRHGVRFLTLFAPSGVPLFLMPLLIVIEVISYLSRPISLSVRLFANMLAGHTMLKLFAGFVVVLLGAGGALAGVAIIPFLAIVAVTALEFLVAFLQAYVFAILTCIYINEALHLHDH